MAVRKTTVSMKDVAALAGVAVGTVSNVLNAPELVAEPTRRKVEAAIDTLGWVRNESARQLRAGRSRSVGLVVLDISNPFFTDVVRGVEDCVTDLGYTVQVGNSAQEPGREESHLQLFEQQRVRGLLLAPVGEVAARVAQLRRRGIPVVVVDRAGEDADYCSVAVDDVEGGRLAVAHLVERGHRRIGFVGGPSSLHQVRDRRLGAQLASTRPGDAVELLTVSTPLLDVTSGVRAAEELVALPDRERPTAVFAANDLLAIGLLQGLVTAGLVVPDDMAIVGYDDIAFAAAAAVPLTSVRQPREALGRQAAELLFDEIAAADADAVHAHRQVRFTPELVVRRSSAPRLTAAPLPPA
jgi:LacI family transcriptional regulator, galactose operon repressor